MCRLWQPFEPCRPLPHERLGIAAALARVHAQMKASAYQQGRARMGGGGGGGGGAVANPTLCLCSQQVKTNGVVLYMKGVPAAPQCGFSKMVVQILEIEGEATACCAPHACPAAASAQVALIAPIVICVFAHSAA